MVYYSEKLTGVAVFAKVQGQLKFESPRTRGSADFQTLQVHGPL